MEVRFISAELRRRLAQSDDYTNGEEDSSSCDSYSDHECSSEDGE